MNKRARDTRWSTSVALMVAIVILLANTPLGMIQLPVIKATTAHVPMTLGATLPGPLAGSILGGVFGICSMISNTTAPTLLPLAFSPFMSTTEIQGTAKAIWISVGCRILIGLIPGWLWILLEKCKVNTMTAPPIMSSVGVVTNMVFVMGSIYFLLAKEYAAAESAAVDVVWGPVLGAVTASGIPEVIAAAVLVALIRKVLLKAIK